MKIIPLTQGKVALVDDEDYEWLNQYSWHYGGDGYARATHRTPKKVLTLYMHRMIMKAPKGKEVDHINGNRIDNQCSNLRICTRLENSRNTTVKKANATSKYRGVCLMKVKKYSYWLATITIKKKGITIGTFPTEHHAAMAYDLWAKELFGEYASLNFPSGIHGGRNIKRIRKGMETY